MQNLAENKCEMGATAQYVKRAADQSADFNGRLPFTDLWLKTTVKVTLEILGKKCISRTDFWNEETKEGVSFVLNAQPAQEEEESEAFWNTGSPYASGEGFLPTKMEVSDDAEQNTPKTKEAEARTREAETSSTNVETMNLEEVHSVVDEFVENDKQNEDRKNTEQYDKSDSDGKQFSSEREAQKLSEAEENLEHGKDTGVKHISFNLWPKNDCEGFKAALERATRTFFENLTFC